MRVLCLYLPALPITLARRSLAEPTERPVVLVDGEGPGAPVTAVSPAAATRGVRIGDAVAVARSRLPGAIILADNAGDCLDELERLAAIVSRYATVSVAVESTTRLVVGCPALAGTGEEAFAIRLQQLVRAWGGMPVQAGIGNGRAEALEAAVRSRPGVTVVPPSPGVAEAPVATLTGQTLRVSTSVGADLDGTLRKTARRLRLMQSTASRSARELRLTVRAGETTYRRVLRPRNPVQPHELDERIVAAFEDLPAVRPEWIRVELGRLGPARPVHAEPALARAG